MAENLGELEIQKHQLDKMLELGVTDTIALEAYRGFAFRRWSQIISFLLNQIFFLGMILIFLMPVSLMVLNNLGKISNSKNNTILVVSLITLIAFGCLLLVDIWLWRRLKYVASTARLLEEIDNYNRAIKTIVMLDEIEAARRLQPIDAATNANDRQEVLAALQVTRDSLIGALMAEKIIRNNQNLISSRYQLFAELEQNLATLMTFDTGDQKSEYGRLLDEALKIGINVHKEIRSLQNSQRK